MKDQYVDFAGRYDLPYGPLVQSDLRMTGFFLRLFAEHRVKRVLDCACGTGRHLSLFRDLGCEVHGSDVSPSMLKQARQNLTATGVEIPLRQADYRRLPDNYKKRFDTVICLGAIGYMPDEIQLLKAFKSMGSVLHKDGILVLTAIPTDKQWKEKPRFSLAADTPDCTRVFAMDYFEKTVRYNILDLLRGPSGTELKTWSAELTVLLRDDQERLLKMAGFRQVNFYGDYDDSPYDKATSSQMITVARKLGAK
jgi:glycine/sarcosine N-methyltransferase